MKVLNPIDPTTLPLTGLGGNANNTFDTGLTTGCGTVYYMNKSNVGIMVLLDNGFTFVLPAWYARSLVMQNKALRQTFTQAYTLNQTNPPISQLYMEAFQKGEDTTGLYSGPIPYQNTITGNVNSNVNSTQAILNTGQPANTAVVTVQPVDASSHTWDVDNEGNFVLSVNVGGVVTPILVIHPSQNTVINCQSGQVIDLQVNGTSALQISGGNITLMNGNRLALTTGHLARKSAGTNAAGSGTSISHGLGITPEFVGVTPLVSQPGSATVGAGNIGSTTFTCTIGAGTQVNWFVESPT